MGIDERRFRLEWISASEGEKVQRVINEISAEVKSLGPLRLEPVPVPHAEAHAVEARA